MKVHELIDRLEGMDEDAEVMIMSQENWPFEQDIAGVAVRRDFDEDDGEEDGENKNPNDVFIVEGYQLRYGSKGAWEYCS